MPRITVRNGLRNLEIAVKSGDLKKLDRAIAWWSTDRELKDILTDALVISCANLCQQAAFHMLERPGIDPNSTSELIEGYERVPPLTVAISGLWVVTGQASPEISSIAERLIERGTEVDILDPDGLTPLHHAVAQRNTTLTQLLLEKGAKTSVGRDYSPLYLACVHGAETLVKLLLRKNADAEAPTSEQMMPLHVAAAQGNCNIVELLLPHTKLLGVNAVCIGGWTPLHLACVGDQSALIYSLARAGLRKRFPGSTGASTTVDRCRVAEILLSNGADVNLKSNSLKTALHLAAASGDKGIICLLLSQEYIRIAAKDHRGNTPLLDAVEARQSRDIIDLLVPWSHRAVLSLPPCVKQVIEDSYVSIIDFAPPHFDSHNSRKTIFDLLYMSEKRDRHGMWRPAATKPRSREKGSFRWIHLPANNMSWCQTLIARWFVEGDCLERQNYVALERSLSQQQHQGPKVHSTHMRPTFSQLPEDGNSKVFMFMPYLELDTTQDGSVGRNTPITEAYDSWKANDHCHHSRRTLDQFWYKSLDTERRDTDQVISRYLKDRDISGLLVVDQLWIWILGPDLIITSFPHTEHHRLIDQSPLFTSILERIDPRTGGLVRNVGELADVIVEQCVTACDRSIRRKCNADYFDIFKFSATAVMEAQIKLFSEFQQTSIAATEWIKGSLRNSTTYQTEPLPFVESLLTLRREIDLLVEARDIEDELGILKHVLDDQTFVIGQMQLGTQRPNSFDQKLDDLMHQRFDIPQMTEWMRVVSASITDLLEHKQRYTNAIDANFAREQAKSAEAGNRTLLVFTIVTIVFAPMSFLAAFFAINTQEVSQNFKQKGVSGLDVVYRYVVGLGLGTAGFIILVALTYQWAWAKIVELWEKRMKRSNKSGAPKSTKTEQGSQRADRDSAKSGSSSSISRLPLPHRRDAARRDVEAGEGSSA